MISGVAQTILNIYADSDILESFLLIVSSFRKYTTACIAILFKEYIHGRTIALSLLIIFLQAMSQSDKANTLVSAFILLSFLIHSLSLCISYRASP